MSSRRLRSVFLCAFSVMAPLQQVQAATSVELKVSRLNRYEQAMGKYYLESLIAPGAATYSFDRYVINCDLSPEGTCDSLRDYRDTDGTLRLDELEGYWLDHYHERRAERGDLEIFPETLAEFMDKTSYRSWPSFVVEASVIKRAKRVIYRGILPDQRRISVAETHTPTGEIRETEIGINGLTESGTYHFYVYGHTGLLQEVSEFPAGIRPSPSTCVVCHANRNTGMVNRFFPF